LIWVQAAALFVFGLAQGYSLTSSLLDIMTIVISPALTEGLRIRNQSVRSTSASFALIASSAVLTSLSGGYIEAHFHFFVMLAVIALYQSWVPFLISILFVLIHHGVGGVVAPSAVFNHPDAVANPWLWAAIHAGFVAAACGVYMVAWRWNEIAQAHTEHILNAAGEGIIGIDPSGNILFVNPTAERIMRQPAERLLGTSLDPFVRLVSAELDLGDQDSQHQSINNAPADQTMEGVLDIGADSLPVEFVRTEMWDRGRMSGEVVTIRDISQRKVAEKALRENEQRFRSLVQNASDMITVISLDTTVSYQSPSIERVLGYQVHELVGRKLVELFHREDVPRVLSFLTEAMMRPAQSAVVETRVQHANGSWRDLEIIGTDQRLDPSVGGFVLNIRDVSERKALERQLRHQAFHDSLTNLANRASFFDRIEHALSRGGGNGTGIAVIFLDLDDFKSVNDSLGHDAGDQLLSEVGQRLQRCIRPADTAARLGGDEFAILLEDITDVDYARYVSNRLLDVLRLPYELSGKDITIRASIGIASSLEHDVEAGELLRNADIAMYEAKRSGGSRFSEYTSEMYAATLDRLDLLEDLQHALARDEFEVLYQPTVVLDSQRIVGFEALVRWRHPQRGLLSPADFIRLAEESGVILPLGRWVLQQACSQAVAWQRTFPNEPKLTMNVNVSVYQLHHPQFIAEVAEALRHTGLEPSTLVLEVTESAMLQNTRKMLDCLEELKQLGVRLAIDDFGTGYSSLSYLSQYPFDVLKIDKAFIDQEFSEPEVGTSRKEVARAIIDLGKTLQLKIIAEGIERADQLATLQALDCEFGQGYLFARPLSAGEIEDMLTERRAA
jgi:diguanylate cyclase (GGDEF)-like protein/PAS domain S-box-containing protein